MGINVKKIYNYSTYLIMHCFNSWHFRTFIFIIYILDIFIIYIFLILLLYIIFISYYHKCSGLKTTYLLSHNSGGQKSGIGHWAKIKVLAGCVPSGGSWGGVVPLPFPVLRSYLNFLAHRSLPSSSKSAV